jgi:hypothetical protein
MTLRTLTLLIAVGAMGVGAAAADNTPVGNLGYNSYEGYLSKGAPLEKYFGPGVGYPTDVGGDYFRRYYSPNQWNRYGYGTGHIGEGYGPLIFPDRNKPTPPGMFDPLPPAYRDAPPPRIKISNGRIKVMLPRNIPGIRCVTVTMVAYNNADLCVQTLKCEPFAFDFPVMDGVKNVRVRIDYEGAGMSATSYPLA